MSRSKLVLEQEISKSNNIEYQVNVIRFSPEVSCRSVFVDFKNVHTHWVHKANQQNDSESISKR